MHTLKPLDNEAIFKASEETSGIISIEENTIIGGLGASIAEVCLDYSLNPGFFKRIGLNDVYSTIVGDQYFLRHHYDMDSHYIVNVIKETISHQN